MQALEREHVRHQLIQQIRFDARAVLQWARQLLWKGGFALACAVRALFDLRVNVRHYFLEHDIDQRATFVLMSGRGAQVLAAVRAHRDLDDPNCFDAARIACARLGLGCALAVSSSMSECGLILVGLRGGLAGIARVFLRGLFHEHRHHNFQQRQQRGKQCLAFGAQLAVGR